MAALASRMLNFTSVAVVVKDAKKSAQWYKEKLGFEVRDEMGHWITVAPKGSNVVFHLCQDFYPIEPGVNGISFMTKDVAKEEKALRAKGVEFTQPTKKEDWGISALFRDPDGNEFTLLQE